jgi:hypothetical protein
MEIEKPMKEIVAEAELRPRPRINLSGTCPIRSFFYWRFNQDEYQFCSGGWIVAAMYPVNLAL